MNTIRRIAILIALMLPVLALGKVWHAEDFPMVHLQDARKYVCDPDHVLSQAAKDSIDALFGKIESTRGIQAVMAVAREIEDGDAYKFGMGIAKKYKVGLKSQNSGLIIVLSTEDRKYYILTGSGLEGVLPDAICRRIENRYMVPYLKKGDWDAAMLNTVKAIYAVTVNGSTLKPEQADNDDMAPMFIALVIVVLLSIIVFVVASRASTKWCPKCHNHSLRCTGDTLRRTGDNKILYVYRCDKCGYTVARDSKGNDNDDSGLSSTIPFILMGGSIGSAHGFDDDGISGGSFGGGNFGGGGAGGSF